MDKEKTEMKQGWGRVYQELSFGYVKIQMPKIDIQMEVSSRQEGPELET